MPLVLYYIVLTVVLHLVTGKSEAFCPPQPSAAISQNDFTDTNLKRNTGAITILTSQSKGRGQLFATNIAYSLADHNRDICQNEVLGSTSNDNTSSLAITALGVFMSEKMLAAADKSGHLSHASRSGLQVLPRIRFDSQLHFKSIGVRVIYKF